MTANENAAATESRPPTGLSWRAWLLLILYTGSLYTWYLGPCRCITGHECHNIEAAREMAASGDWLVPRIAGQPWLEKPPLPHWCIALAGCVSGGFDTWTARLPSALAGLAGVLVLAALASRWFGPTRGLLTGLVQATTFYQLCYARLAEADIYLWLMVVAAIALFGRELVEPRAPATGTGRLAFFTLLGATNLAKGPMFGTVITLAPCVAFVLLQRRWSGWKWLLYWPGLLVAAALAVAWPAAILTFYPQADDLWWIHTFGRLHSETSINPKPLWYYLTTLPWQIIPWGLPMLVALPAAVQRGWREPGSADRFLCLWLLVPLVVLSIPAAKHHHYLIYALPPCSFWAADGLLRLRERLGSLLRRRAGLALTAVAVAGGLAAALTVARRWPEHARDAACLTTLALAGCAVVGWGLARARYRMAAISLFALVWCVVGYVHAVIMPVTDHYREETALLRRTAARTDWTSLHLIAVSPSRLMLYLPDGVECHRDLDTLRQRLQEEKVLHVLSVIQLEPALQAMARATRLDEAERPRWKSLPSDSRLALYRLEGRR